MNRTLGAVAMAVCVLSLSCESLLDSRAWGNGSGRGAEARFRVPSQPGRSAEPKTSAKAPAAASAAGPKPVAASTPVQPQAAAAKATKPGRVNGQGYETMARESSSGNEAGDRVIKSAIARIDKGTVLKGSCYDFVQACYVDAGFKGAGIKRIFLGKQSGPFADSSLIKKGDWIYFNHMYSATIEHSAIFVLWVDFENRVALTIDYPGGDRAEPGRFRIADLYKVWGIHRPVLTAAGR